MIQISARIFRVVVPCLFTTMAGCSTTGIDSHSKVISQSIECEHLKVSTPSVVYDEESNALKISGTVARKAGVAGDISGHIRIVFMGPDETELSDVTALWSPTKISAENESGSYQIYYGYAPPPGSIVRASHEDCDISESGTGSSSASYGRVRTQVKSSATRRQGPMRSRVGTSINTRR